MGSNYQAEKKGSVGSWFSNLWYYHKWHILVGALVLLVLGVSLVQCIKNEKPDVSILYVGDMDIGNTNREKINTLLEEFYKDVTGDNRKTLSLAFMGEKDPSTKDRIQTEVVAGEHTIYLLDKTNFEWLLKNNVLAPLEEVLGTKPENALNEYGIELKYLDIAETDGFSNMLRDSILCLRGNREGGIDYGNSTALYKNNVDTFIGMVEYKVEGLTRSTVEMALIGDRNLYENCVSDMEHSLYYIAKEQEPNTVAILNYSFLQLKYKENQHIFGDEEKAQAEELAKGNKILLLDADAYFYLSEKGLLCDISTIGANLPDNAEQYGIMLKDLSLFKTNGFYFADDRENSRIYLCGSADITDYTARVLKYLYEFKA